MNDVIYVEWWQHAENAQYIFQAGFPRSLSLATLLATLVRKERKLTKCATHVRIG